MEAPQAKFCGIPPQKLMNYKGNGGAAGGDFEIPIQNTNEIQRGLHQALDILRNAGSRTSTRYSQEFLGQSRTSTGYSQELLGKCRTSIRYSHGFLAESRTSTRYSEISRREASGK